MRPLSRCDALLLRTPAQAPRAYRSTLQAAIGRQDAFALPHAHVQARRVSSTVGGSCNGWNQEGSATCPPAPAPPLRAAPRWWPRPVPPPGSRRRPTRCVLPLLLAGRASWRALRGACALLMLANGGTGLAPRRANKDANKQHTQNQTGDAFSMPPPHPTPPNAPYRRCACRAPGPSRARTARAALRCALPRHAQFKFTVAAVILLLFATFPAPPLLLPSPWLPPA
jgi:hypothetical protein